MTTYAPLKLPLGPWLAGLKPPSTSDALSPKERARKEVDFILALTGALPSERFE